MFVVKHNTNSRGGFTALEMMAVVAISVLLLTITVSMFHSFRDTQVLQGETSQAFSLLDKARSRTLNSEDDSEYGVRINADRIFLFKGSSFSSSSPSNEEYVLHSAVEIASTTLAGGGTDVLFDRLTGETSNNGSFTVRLKDEVSQKNIIYISRTGATAQN